MTNVIVDFKVPVLESHLESEANLSIACSDTLSVSFYVSTSIMNCKGYVYTTHYKFGKLDRKLRIIIIVMVVKSMYSW